MRCLFIGPKSPDYLASCLFDGLQEVLGEENVVDAANSPWLHRSTCLLEQQNHPIGYLGGTLPILALSGTREGTYSAPGEFDIIVINASFNRDFSWNDVRASTTFLKANGKIAYVEGWDAAVQVEPPQIHVDAVFRKEIGRWAYPYDPHYLTFAAPARWFHPDDGQRLIDIFWSGNPNSCLPGQEVRRPMLKQVWNTRQEYKTIISTAGLGFDHYFDLLRHTKLALCPSGADLTDSLRTFEAVACGAVPVFVGYPDYIRDPWFPNDTCFNCTTDTLPGHLDEALSHDLTGRRQALVEHAKKYHTTAARARQMLEVLL